MSSTRALVLLVLLGAVASSHAQTGPFVPGESYALSSSGGSGVFTTSGVDSLQIDRNGNDVFDAGDTRHPMPSGLLDDIDQQSFRLSPSRDHVIVEGTSAVSPCVGEAVVYVYEIPAGYGAPLIPVGGKVCVPNGIADTSFYDRPAFSTQRIMAIREIADTITLQAQIHWFDLTSGLNSTSDFPFDSVVASVTFAPTGIAALVQYATSDGDNFSDYRLVELCAGDLGRSYNPAGLPPAGLPTPPATGNVALVGSDLVGQIVHEGSVIASANLDDCGTVPPTTGACCFTDGSCQNSTTPTECASLGGTFQTIGSTCTSVECPQPPGTDLSLTASGPASLASPGQIVYQLDYRNDGNIEAAFAQVFATLPNGTTFVSASIGGIYFAGQNRVRWTVGTIPAGGSGSVSFIVEVGCGQSNVLLSSYYMFSSSPPGGTVLGSPSVSTSVAQPSGDPLAVDLISTADGPVPLLRDGTVTHTIFLVNPDPVPRAGLEIGFWIGAVWRFDSVLDDGGGTVTATPGRFDWTGSVPASGSIEITFRTRMPACGATGSNTEDALNYGNPFDVVTACGTAVGTLFPASIAIAPPPISTTTSIVDAGEAIGVLNDIPILLIRAGQAATVELSFTNVYPVPVDSINVSSAIPAPLVPSNDPPWVGTPPAGAAWDAATATISWAGSLASGANVTLRWSVEVPDDGACEFVLDTSLSSETCTTNSNSRVLVEAIPSLPAAGTGWLAGITPFRGMVHFVPGQHTALEPLLCYGNEFNIGLGRAPDGSFWAVGSPFYRFHPGRLELEIFEFSDVAGGGLDQIRDVAFSADGQTVYFGGFDHVLQDHARIAAWDRTSDTFTVLYAEDTSVSPPIHGPVDDLQVGPDGHLIATTQNGILRIDPTTPGAPPEVLTDPGFLGGYGATTFDTSGDLLTTWRSFVSGQPRPLVTIDTTTGVFTEEIADLTALGLTFAPIVSLAAEGTDRVWMAPESGSIYVLDRKAVPPTVTALPIVAYPSVVDLVWVEGSAGTSVDPEVVDGVVMPRALALQPVVPNPFNPRARIGFSLPKAASVRVEVFDLRGRRVRVLVDEVLDAGNHERTWTGVDDDGRAVSSGVYLVRLQSDGEGHVRRAVLVR